MKLNTVYRLRQDLADPAAGHLAEHFGEVVMVVDIRKNEAKILTLAGRFYWIDQRWLEEEFPSKTCQGG